MIRSNPGVQRPFLYVVVAALGIVMAIPLAISSGQMSAGGIFDECYAASCDKLTLTANAAD